MTRLRRLTPTICAFHLGFGLVSAPNGAFATDAHGPGLLRLLAKTLGQDHRPQTDWSTLERAEKTALLRKAAGIPSFTQTGLVPRQNMREFAAEMTETVDRLYPQYRVDSLQCQLGMLEGCDTTGQGGGPHTRGRPLRVPEMPVKGPRRDAADPAPLDEEPSQALALDTPRGPHRAPLPGTGTGNQSLNPSGQPGKTGR